MKPTLKPIRWYRLIWEWDHESVANREYRRCIYQPDHSWRPVESRYNRSTRRFTHEKPAP